MLIRFPIIAGVPFCWFLLAFANIIRQMRSNQQNVLAASNLFFLFFNNFICTGNMLVQRILVLIIRQFIKGRSHKVV